MVRPPKRLDDHAKSRNARPTGLGRPVKTRLPLGPEAPNKNRQLDRPATGAQTLADERDERHQLRCA